MAKSLRSWSIRFASSGSIPFEAYGRIVQVNQSNPESPQQRHRSHHPKDQALKVMGLGNGQENRVITRLRAALNDGDGAPGVEGGARDGSQQVGLAHVEGTGAGEQEPSRVEDLQAAQVQFLVTT